MRRICLAFACLVLFASPPMLRAGETPDAPSIVVRVKSLQALLQNVNLVVKLAGQDETADQIEGLIKSKIGKNGIKGIDPARPLGAYARYGKEIDSLQGAILIPVADESSIMTLLDNLGLAVQKSKDGLYTYKGANNVDVYFRFANKYLYVTSGNAESIQGTNLVDPAKALTMPGDATVSFLAHLDRMPKAAKKLALAHLDDALAEVKKKELPKQSKAQQAFQAALLSDFHGFARRVLDEGSELQASLDVNDQTRELAINFQIKAKPQSDLAKWIQSFGNLKSPLAGIAPGDAAFHGAFHLVLDEGLHKAVEGVIQEASANSLEGIKDADKRKQAETLFNAIMPTAKAGEYQAVAVVLGPKNDHYTFLGALKLKEGLKLGAIARDLIADAAKQVPAADKGKIHLDFDTVGAAKIHKFELPKNSELDALIKNTGDSNLYIAFRDDALFAALGQEALPAMKSALGKTDGAASRPFVFDLDAGRMGKWLAHSPQQLQHAKVLAAGNRLRVTVEGGANLRVDVRTHFNVLEFLVKTGEQKGK